MYFDDSNNYVSAEQICKNIKTKQNSVEYKNAMKELIREMKLQEPNKFKK